MEPDFRVGELLGHGQLGKEDFERDFRIGELLGSGKFGDVYKCISVSTSKAFAVKIIDKLSAFFDNQLVYSEIKLNHLAASENSRCIQIHRVYDDMTAIYIIFDLCPAPNLSYCIVHHGPFCKSWAAAIMKDLAEAIVECHRRGIIHRDINPENILFDSICSLILANFGCAALLEKGSKTLKERIGTPSFMAPEMIAGKEYDEKVDVWSAGVVLYMMLGQTLPFNGNSEEEIFSAVMKGEPLCFPKKLFLWSSPQAEDLMKKMLDRDPIRRLSAEQVLAHRWISAPTLPWRE